MYLRITRGRIDPTRYDELTTFYEDLLTALRRQPGFQSSSFGADRTNGTVVALSFWDTKEHAQLDRAALGDVISRTQALGLQLDPAEIYEVVTQT